MPPQSIGVHASRATIRAITKVITTVAAPRMTLPNRSQSRRLQSSLVTSGRTLGKRQSLCSIVSLRGWVLGSQSRKFLPSGHQHVIERGLLRLISVARKDGRLCDFGRQLRSMPYQCPLTRVSMFDTWPRLVYGFPSGSLDRDNDAMATKPRTITSSDTRTGAGEGPLPKRRASCTLMSARPRPPPSPGHRRGLPRASRHRALIDHVIAGRRRSLEDHVRAEPCDDPPFPAPHQRRLYTWTILQNLVHRCRATRPGLSGASAHELQSGIVGGNEGVPGVVGMYVGAQVSVCLQLQMFASSWATSGPTRARTRPQLEAEAEQEGGARGRRRLLPAGAVEVVRHHGS